MRAFLSAAKLGWLSALLLWLALGPRVAQATHIRAGDIQSKVDTTAAHNPNRIFFRLTLYCNVPGSTTGGVADQPNVSILFGDGSRQDNILRSRTIPVPGRSDVVIYTYNFDHTFPGPKNYPGYTVSFVGENRNGGIVNMTNSIGQTFYIYTNVVIDPVLGLNHSPVLRAPAFDEGAVGQVYLHNPAGYDADGDSLAFKPRESYQVPGGLPNGAVTVNPSITQGYVYPNSTTIAPNATMVTYPGIPTPIAGSQPTYTQDISTGQIVWNAPGKQGYYNVAMRVEEWRRYPNGARQQIGEVNRDIQIIINATNNLPPQLTTPADVCVQAGQPVTLTVSATDGQATGASSPTPVTLTAYSGILPPATFTTTASGTTTTGTFKWTPDCSNVAQLPYTVVFKAQDSPYTGTPTLIDERPVRITVVGPPPQNLTVTQVPNAPRLTASLSWSRYVCSNASNIRIYRRENSYSWTPGACETGIPASAGYSLVGTVAATATTFSDDNAGNGLVRGKTYCYRIYAVFPLPAGGASIASAEACLQTPGRSPLLTNVDVNSTNAITGQITVKWTRPLTDAGGTAFGTPAGYRLMRSVGTSATFTQVYTTSSLADTTFVDTGLDTNGSQYTYKLVFFRTNSGVETTDETATASSVRTTVVPNGLNNSIAVTWAYQVPWDNSQQPSHIYRRTNNGSFVKVADVKPGATSGTFTDTGLQQNQTYCYYVQTVGQYASPINSANQLIYNNLLNSSQEVCVTLRPVPCTPVLSIKVINCDSLAARPQYPEPNQRYQNLLTWTVGNTPANCLANATSYRVFRADTEAGPFTQIGTTTTLSYLDQGLTQQNYCYQVQGVAATGELSAVSNTACQTECLFFLLPNIFIPGSDVVANRVFRPKTTSPITRTHIQIFNRWGRKVYESDKDPYINWTGGGVPGESASNDLAPGGIYYYLAEVQFADSAHTTKVYKGWVELKR